MQDPEGILGPPQGGHIGRLEFKRRLERDADAREAFNRQIHEQKERRRALRQVGNRKEYRILWFLLLPYDNKPKLEFSPDD